MSAESRINEMFENKGSTSVPGDIITVLDQGCTPTASTANWQQLTGPPSGSLSQTHGETNGKEDNTMKTLLTLSMLCCALVAQADTLEVHGDVTPTTGTGTLQFASGDIYAEVLFPLIRSENDTQEPDRAYTFALYDPQNLELGPVKSVRCVIIDDDPTPIIGITSASVEPDGQGGYTLRFALALSNGTAMPNKVNWAFRKEED